MKRNALYEIKSLMSRIDEDFELHEPDYEDSLGVPQSDNTEQGNEFMPNVSQDSQVSSAQNDDSSQTDKTLPAFHAINGLLSSVGGLGGAYDDSKFDTFFTLVSNQCKACIGLMNKTDIRDVGNGVGFYHRATKIEFSTPSYIFGNLNFPTFYDAIFAYSMFLYDAGKFRPNKTALNIGVEKFLSTKSQGESQTLDESYSYGDTMSLLQKFNSYPKLQGLLKEAHHSTSQTGTRCNIKAEFILGVGGVEEAVVGKSTSERLNALLVKSGLGGEEHVYYLTKIYDGQQVLYIPALDKIRNKQESAVISEKIIRALVDIYSKAYNITPEERNSLSMQKFWELADSKSNGNLSKIIGDEVELVSGVDTITDEFINSLKVFLRNSSAFLDDNQGLAAARERRVVLNDSYGIMDNLKTYMVPGSNLSISDTENMQNISVREWFEQNKDNKGTGLHGDVFTPKFLSDLVSEIQVMDDDEQSTVSIYSFFRRLFGTDKSSTQKLLLANCKNTFKSIRWFGDTMEKSNKVPEIQTYLLDTNGKNKLGYSSLDMVAFRDVPNVDGSVGRYFVSIEYQGDQHYRPWQTESISDDILYPWEVDSTGSNFMWEEYWAIIDAVLGFSDGMDRINESKDAMFDRILRTLIKEQQDYKAANGMGGGRLYSYLQQTGYNIGGEYDSTSGDEFKRWKSSSSNRPDARTKPLKTSAADTFATSFYRWYCEVDVVVQGASDIVKFNKVNGTEIFGDTDGVKSLGSTLFYVCPSEERVVPAHIIANALHNPYRTEYYNYASQPLNEETAKGPGMSKINIRDTFAIANKIYNNTFRGVKITKNNKTFDISKCVSLSGDGSTLKDAILRATGGK